MRSNIKFASPRIEAPLVFVEMNPAATCLAPEALFSFYPIAPEKKFTLPENQRLMPENEPENFQVHSEFSGSSTHFKFFCGKKNDLSDSTVGNTILPGDSEVTPGECLVIFGESQVIFGDFEITSSDFRLTNHTGKHPTQRREKAGAVSIGNLPPTP